ncbi:MULTISPECIES: TetR/AcrR family transcriptional regulator [Clostridium]|uniref:TetR family transcriptional regulator n=1 Tax=Clostridium sporogenes TaxID=1509 RepID=A0A7U4XTF5_CLOSG|nr:MULTISPECIES: TetR/AcrR family transcriptional regulator [Clostridium]AVP61390.1 TetR/AcrR family transcriptional regulator [Clostridium botulinum]AKC61443.1 TetR family transcriptional regulator [Clostridium sporogenes]AKJ88772.1 TetR family transcriptional regulator [Clostridium sporogenes]EHN15269.1 TetR family transcriptional regulator [Clostridium sporogenes PA 3679]KCZ68748.1 TetR family transcriptional regulator [Clostridium sporogenes]
MSKEKKYQIRNEKIIETAEKLIKQKGYHHFKMSDISDELDIGKGTIYNHYPSKEDLLFTLIYPKLQKLQNCLRQISESNISFEEKIRKVIHEVIESDYHQFLLLSYSDIAALFQEKNQKDMELIQDQIIQEFKNIIALGINEGIISQEFSIDFLSHQILSALNPLLHSLLVTDSAKMTHDEFIKQTVEILLYGIKKG